MRFSRQGSWLLLCAVILLVPGPIMSLKGVQAQATSITFPETGKTITGRFLQYWQDHGGLAQHGYPISDVLGEVSDTDGKTYTVQYFERAVFELHPENQAPNDVLLSLLGAFRYASKYSGGATAEIPNKNNARIFAETGKTVGGQFRAYWERHGGLAQQGLPLSDEFQEISDLDGKGYTVQYFERAVFELHPENPPGSQVLLSQLGTFRYQQKTPIGGWVPPPNPVPAAIPIPVPPTPAALSSPTPIQMSGSQHPQGSTTRPTPVTVNGRTYDAYITTAIKRNQWYHYTCEFDAAWIVLKTYGYDPTLDDLLDAVGHDKSIEPYYRETANGVVVYGGDIINAYSGDYTKNFLARSTGAAMRKAFEAYDLQVTPVRDRPGLEDALLRGELVWIKTTVDFKPWVPVTWIMPDGGRVKGVLGNDHALVVMGFNQESVVIRDPLGPTSTNWQRKYEYEVPWSKFLAAWGAQNFDGLAVTPPTH